jgi:DNA invertase Pin-like site-specific DNA recombinase
MPRDRTRAELLEEFLYAWDEVYSASEALQHHLGAYREELERARRHLDAGGSVPDLLSTAPVTVKRSAKEPVHRLEVARARAGRGMYRLAAADGMNAAEIGRAWNVSRQLVSRILNDSEERR